MRASGDEPIFEDDWVACMSAHYQQALIDGDLDNVIGLHFLLDQLGMAAEAIDTLEAAAGVRFAPAPTTTPEAEPVAELPVPTTELMADSSTASVMPIADELPALIDDSNGSDSAIETVHEQTMAQIVAVSFEPVPPSERELALTVDIGALAADPLSDPLMPQKPNKSGRKAAKPVPKTEADKNQLSLF